MVGGVMNGDFIGGVVINLGALLILLDEWDIFLITALVWFWFLVIIGLA